jgi:hypothetical protein
MKRTLMLTIVFFFFVFKANSQLEKNSWLVGGNGFYTSTKSSFEYQINEFKIAPNVGFFAFNNFAGGLRASFTTRRTTFTSQSANISSDTSRRRWYELGPFVRYYFLKPDKMINVFVEGSYLLGISKTILASATETSSTDSYSISAGPAIFFNPSISMELTLGYTFKDYGAELNESKLFINIGFQIHLKK